MRSGVQQLPSLGFGRRMWRGLPASLLALSISASAAAAVLAGEVVAVTDGDTIKVLDAGKVEYLVRLSGIDAPEKKMPFGQRSKQNLSNLVYGKWVEVEGKKHDRYGRLVGKVLVNGTDANLAQVQAGMAWHYKQYEREQLEADRQVYAEAEIKAAASKQGLWVDRHPTAPWDWRKERRPRD
jgi:endonuclease YncB( thermonuclease family)